jgi:hypothetical protein
MLGHKQPPGSTTVIVCVLVTHAMQMQRAVFGFVRRLADVVQIVLLPQQLTLLLFAPWLCCCLLHLQGQRGCCVWWHRTQPLEEDGGVLRRPCMLCVHPAACCSDVPCIWHQRKLAGKHASYYAYLRYCANLLAGLLRHPITNFLIIAPSTLAPQCHFVSTQAQLQQQVTAVAKHSRPCSCCSRCGDCWCSGVA